MFRLQMSMPPIPDLPQRVPLEDDGSRVLDLVMYEYAAIRNEIDTSLTAQISLLSFGSATVGLLVAAAGSLWKDEPLLSGFILLFVVPAASFLALAIHAGEMVRLMRAGLFLNDLENAVNGASWVQPLRGAGAGVLIWEQWGIREGGADMAGNNRRAITSVFALLAFGFMLAGFWRLHEIRGLHEAWAIGILAVSLLCGTQALRWVIRLHRYAHLHRKRYVRTCVSRSDAADTSAMPTPRGPESAVAGSPPAVRG